MVKYTVEVREVWVRTFTIESDPASTNAAGLRDRANAMIEAGDEDQGFEYSRTLDPDQWIVRDEQGNFLE